MHALKILHHTLVPLLTHIHRRRLETLLEAVAASLRGPRLTLTDLGRRFAGTGQLRYKIKRADRLLGNTRLQGEARSFYGALCQICLRRIREPLIIIDWSDLKADQSLHLLRASLPVGGRALTLYEEVHQQKKLNNRRVQERFLERLAALLPPDTAPVIVADAGFKVPFYRAVERLGWRWVGRVRGRDYLRLSRRWASCKTVFRRATETATSLGVGEWVKSNPLRALFVLVRQAPKGRRAKTATGRRARSKKSQQAARAAREPWLLVASPQFADWAPKRVVRCYRQRMQIEEAFRDLKSQHFGAGLECSRSEGVGRYTVLMLIAALAAWLLWLLGTAAEHANLHRHLHPGNGKRRVYSRLFLARLLLVLHDYQGVLDDLIQRVGSADEWLASDHAAALAE